MAQYIYSMNRVGKIVPPKKYILKDISLKLWLAMQAVARPIKLVLWP